MAAKQMQAENQRQKRKSLQNHKEWDKINITTRLHVLPGYKLNESQEDLHVVHVFNKHLDGEQFDSSLILKKIRKMANFIKTTWDGLKRTSQHIYMEDLDIK